MSQMSQNKMERKSSFRSYSSVVSTSIKKSFSRLFIVLKEIVSPNPIHYYNYQRKKWVKDNYSSCSLWWCGYVGKGKYKINKRDEYSQQNSWIQWEVFFFLKKCWHLISWNLSEYFFLNVCERRLKKIVKCSYSAILLEKKTTCG